MAQVIVPPQSDDVLLKGFDPQVTRRLVGFARPYGLQVLLSLVFMFISSAVVVAGPYLVKIALDSGLDAGSLPVLRQCVLLYLLLAFIQWVVTYLRINIMVRVGQSIIYDMRASPVRAPAAAFTRFLQPLQRGPGHHAGD